MSFLEDMEAVADENTTPEEVMLVINAKDSYRSGVIEDILEEIYRNGDFRSRTPAKIEIRLGLQLDSGPGYELDWLVKQIRAAAVSELYARKAISNFQRKTRKAVEKKYRYDEAVAIIDYVPDDFLRWYGKEELGAEAMGKLLAYYPLLATEIGDVVSAIYYSQIYAWWEAEKGADGFVVKSIPEIGRATTLTREQQDRIREQLQGTWLEVPPRDGNKPLRYKPLKPLSMRGKSTDAIAQKPPHIKILQTPKTIEECLMEHNGIFATLANTPAWKLKRYANPRTGELPEFNGEGPSEWAKRADQIIDTDEFIQYHGDVDAAVRDYDICRKLKKQDNELIKKIKTWEQKKLSFAKAIK